MKLKSVCLFIFIKLIMFSSFVWAGAPDVFRTGQILTEIETSYFATDENYNVNGERTPLTNGDALNVLNMSFLAAYFLPNAMSLTGGAQLTRVESESSFEDRTNSEFNELSVLFRKLVVLNSIRFIPELGYAKALNEISIDSDETFTSDAADVIKIGSWVMTKWDRIYPYFHMSYLSRSRDLSSLLTWKIGSRYKMSAADIGVEWRGFQSVSDDVYTDNPAQRQIENSVLLSNSNRFNTVNPSAMDLKMFANYYASKTIAIGGAFTYPISGENVAYGNEFQILFSWYLDAGKPTEKKSAKELKQRRKPLQKIKENDSSDEEFEPVMEDYDETLFESN
jgi:hypothetical protein